MPRELRPVESQSSEPPREEHEASEHDFSSKTAIPDVVLNKLHPYTKTLTLADVDSCLLLEEAAFPPQERCTREKVSRVDTMCMRLTLFCISSMYMHTLCHSIRPRGRQVAISRSTFAGPARQQSRISVENAIAKANHLEQFEYRFRVCGELSLGLFSSQPQDDVADTAQAAVPIESKDKQRKAVLLAHVVTTKTAGSTVTDDDMAMPSTSDSDPRLGHKESGRTVCIHSLAVLPAYQHKGLGTTLLKAYLERLRASGAADSVAIIAHDHLIDYYKRFGFESLGPSQARFGGGGWYDMVLTL